MSDDEKRPVNLNYVLAGFILCAIVFNWFGAREIAAGILQGAGNIAKGVAQGQASNKETLAPRDGSGSGSAQPTASPSYAACGACNGNGVCPKCHGRRELTYQCALCFGKGGVKSVLLEWMNDFTSKMKDGQGYEGSKDYVECPECRGRGDVVDSCMVKKVASGGFYVCSGKCLQCGGAGDAASYPGWTVEWAPGSADDWFALKRPVLEARYLRPGGSTRNYGDDAWDKLKSGSPSTSPPSSSEDGWWSN